MANKKDMIMIILYIYIYILNFTFICDSEVLTDMLILHLYYRDKSTGELIFYYGLLK